MSKDSPKRGEIFWVSLDPTIGTEVNKTRPGLILSNNIANLHSNRVIVAPITSSITKIYPFEVRLKMPQGVSKAMIDQLRSIDKRRLGKRICSIENEELIDVEKALKLTLALP